jgi:hypothetical protein
MELKINDVYRFSYHDAGNMFMPYHCFDGQLVVRQKENGNLYLEDTYWGWKDGSNKTFTPEQALECGALKFICNLDDVQKCEEYNFNYYADDDLFNLSYQHGCYKRFYKKLGAQKSFVKMEQILKNKITSAENEIEFQNNQIKYYKEKLKELQNGDINIYI